MLIIILALIATLIYYFGINRILGLPPGPHPFPIIGNMLSFQWDIDKVLLDWKSRYGRIFTIWLPFPIIVIGDHKLLQEHVVRNGDIFIDKRNPEQFMEMQSGGLYGLVFEDNSMVKEQRKFALKTLHEIGFGSAALEDSVHSGALEVVAEWIKSEGEVVDVAENIEKAIGNIVWNITFGIELTFDNDIVEQFRQYQQEAIPLAGTPLMMFLELFPPLRKLDFLFGNKIKRLQELLDIIGSMVTEAIKMTEQSFDMDNQPRSYVEAFLREMKKNKDAGKAEGNYTYQQMHSSAFSLWAAGFDTSVGLLRLCILELVNHPEVQRKIHQEIDQRIGERRIRNEDQKLLPYTCAFLQEVYRVGSVLPINFIRQTSQDTEIEGWKILSGTNVLPQYSMVHSDPNEFERPDYFRPERHIEDDNFVKDPRITPFSVGKRSCLGETLARMEMFVMIATFVQNCRFTCADEVPPPVEFTYGITRAVKEFSVRIHPRN